MTNRVVPRLQVDSPLEGLAIRDAGFRLDSGPPLCGIAAPDFRVPSAQVALDPERHFRSPTKARVESGSESLEQGNLGPVADRIAGRVDPQGEIEAENRAVSRQKRQIWIGHLATLEPPDHRVRRTDRASDLGLAQTGSDPGKSPIDRNATHRIPTAPPATIGDTLPSDHRGGSSHGPLSQRFTRAVGTLSVRTGDRGPKSRTSRRLRPLAGTPGDRIDDRGRSSSPETVGRPLVGTPTVQTGSGHR
jgi:hypothetical protein